MTPKAAWVAAWAVATTRTIRKADAIAQRLAAEKAAAEAQAADMAAAEQRAAAMAAEEAAVVARRAAALRAQASYRAAALNELQRKQEEARVTAQMDMPLDVEPTEAVSGASSTSVLSSTMRYGALAALAAGIVIASRFLGAAGGGSSSWASRTAGAQTAASVAVAEGVPNLYVRETTIGKAARR
jgi:ATPase subunit of ABC transporter with duplicated ATPase domains